MMPSPVAAAKPWSCPPSPEPRSSWSDSLISAPLLPRRRRPPKRPSSAEGPAGIRGLSLPGLLVQQQGLVLADDCHCHHPSGQPPQSPFLRASHSAPL